MLQSCTKFAWLLRISTVSTWQLQCLGATSDSAAAARALIQASCPMFEAFWQGRLIPGARIDSLPFVEVTYH